MTELRRNFVSTPLNLGFFAFSQLIAFAFFYVCIKHIRDPEYTKSAILLIGICLVFEMVVFWSFWRMVDYVEYHKKQVIAYNFFGRSIWQKQDAKLEESRYYFTFSNKDCKRSITKRDFSKKVRGEGNDVYEE
jgi:hypothetical protein